MAFDVQRRDTIFAADATISANRTISSGTKVTIDETIPASTTNQLVAFTLDVSQCKAFSMISTVNMTVKTNSSGSPADTVVLAANIPYVWTNDDYTTFKLGTDVTALYITNATTGAGTFTLISLADPTV